MAKLDYDVIFGKDFSLLRQSFNVEADLERMLVANIDNLVFSVQNFARNLESTVIQMTANGIDGSIIRQTLKNDLTGKGRIFGQLRNDIKSSMVMGVSQTARLGQYEDYTNKNKFSWVTVGGHKICLDCDGRQGAINTYAQWESEGLPGSGWSVCKGYCYCVLDPSGKGSTKVQGAPVKEKRLPKTPKDKVGDWKKFIIADNVAARNHMRKAMEGANDKFKELLKKMPQLRHMTHRSGSGAFYWTNPWKSLKKTYLKNVSNESYDHFLKHGGIHMGELTSKRSFITARHEYGHFIHQNLHHLHIQPAQMNDMIKTYRRSQFYGNPRKFVKESGEWWFRSDLNHKSFIDYLKFDDACVATQKRLGTSLRTKDGRALFAKNKDRWEGMMQRVRYKNDYERMSPWNYSSKYVSSSERLTPKQLKLKYSGIDDDLIKQMIIDKDSDIMGYFQDLIGAVTKNKIGYGHSNYYYTRSGIQMQHHETFANLTAVFSHENPIYWKFLKKEFPELAKYYQNLVDNVLENGYFGH